MAPQGWTKISGVWHDENGIPRPSPDKQRRADTPVSRFEGVARDTVPRASSVPPGAARLPDSLASSAGPDTQWIVVPASLASSSSSSGPASSNAGKQKSGVPRRKPHCAACRRFLRHYSRAVPTLGLLFFLAAVWPRSWCPDLARSFGAAVTILEDVGALVSAASGATVNVTTAFASFSAASIGFVQTRGAMFWCGVDLYDASVQVTSGKLLFVHPDDLWPVLAVQLENASSEFSEKLVAAANAVSLTTPWLDLHDNILHMNSSAATGHHMSLDIHVAALASGYMGLSWQASVTVFGFQWSNPLWEILDASFKTEEAQIVEKLRQLVVATVSVNPAALAFDRRSFDDLAAPLSASWARVFRFCAITIPRLISAVVGWLFATPPEQKSSQVRVGGEHDDVVSNPRLLH